MPADASMIDMTDLKDLTPLAQRLNAVSDNITKSLQTIQDKLNALSLGVEVWVDQALSESSWRDLLDRNNEPTGERQFTARELGYGRFGDGWALLVRERRYVERQGSFGPETEPYDDGQPLVPLVRASRDLRLAAVPLIQKLVDALEAEAQRVLDRGEEVQKIADSLK